MKFVKDVRLVSEEEVVQQHQLLLCGILVGPWTIKEIFFLKKENVEIAKNFNQKWIWRSVQW